MQDLLRALREFNAEREWERFHSPKNLAVAVLIEAAEVAEHFQWLTEEESRLPPPDALEPIRDEIGDVLLTLLNLSDKLGIDLEQAAWQKLGKNRAKYPADRVRGLALKYNRYPVG